MKFKNWLFLFISTLLLGAITIILTGLLLGWEGITRIERSSSELAAAGTWLFFVGMTFSAVSQMGFFSYLLLHRLGLGLFKSYSLWNKVQIVLILFTYFDLIYFRYIAFRQEGETLLDYVWLPTIFLALAILVAYYKAKKTNQTAFIPAILFMYVVTTIETIPAITSNDPDWLILMLVTIFVCNLWQLLILHRLINTNKERSA